MSLVQTGNPSDVTTPLSATVTALTSSSGLVEVTTSTPHLFGNGDTVQMFVSAGVASQSQWVITVIDSTHFTLVGSTFTVTGTGTVLDLSLTPQILTPTDGDEFSLQLSGLLSSQRGILSRTQFTQLQTTNLIRAANSLTILRAIPVPTGQQSVLLTPENNGTLMGGGFAGVTVVFPIGGEYYYDAAYNVVDNSSTAIRPNAVGSTSPGMWRLKGGPLFTIYELYGDTNQFSGPTWETSLSVNTTVGFLTSGSVAFFVEWVTGTSASNMYLNDVIDMRMSVSVLITGSGTFSGGATNEFTRNGIGNVIGTGSKITGTWTSGTTLQVEVVCQYVVTAADIMAGALTIGASTTTAGVSGTITFTSTINNYKFTVRRP